MTSLPTQQQFDDYWLMKGQFCTKKCETPAEFKARIAQDAWNECVEHMQINEKYSNC